MDEAVFSFNTMRTKAWSSSYSSISVQEAKMRFKTMALVAAISEDIGIESYLTNERSISTEEFVKFLEELSTKFKKKPFTIFLDNL